VAPENIIHWDESLNKMALVLPAESNNNSEIVVSKSVDKDLSALQNYGNV
jgi:hypothetical protein